MSADQKRRRKGRGDRVASNMRKNKEFSFEGENRRVDCIPFSLRPRKREQNSSQNNGLGHGL